MTIEQVVIPYTPRPIWKPFHARKERWACLVAHRRAGKTVAAVNDQIKFAVSSRKPRPRTRYIAPLRNQAKSIAWDYAKHFTRDIPGVRFNESELRVDFDHNEARLQLFGADHPDALRGQYSDYDIIDEYAQVKGSLVREVIMPSLTDRQGAAVFLGTPKGRNAFYLLHKRAMTSDAWFSALLKASETGVIPPQELATIRAEMTEDEYNQEFECSFDAAIPGAYYGKTLALIDQRGQLGHFPWVPEFPVYTFWDLGFNDATAIWFVQVTDTDIRVIDHLRDRFKPITHYISLVQNKKYSYAGHYAPHDVKHHEYGTGRTRLEMAENAGLLMTPVEMVGVNEGIEATKIFLQRLNFHEEATAEGLEALRQYRSDYDERNDTLKVKPVHDWSSNDADAMRYMAVTMDTDELDTKYQTDEPAWYRNAGGGLGSEVFAQTGVDI